MDTLTLVTEHLDAGAWLQQQLSQDGFEVTTAFWLQRAEDGAWRFYLVSPLVETAGITQAYRRLHPLVFKIPQPCWLDPVEVKLIGPSNPLARDVLEIHRQRPGTQVGPIRWEGSRLGNMSVEGAYLYPLPASAAV